MWVCTRNILEETPILPSIPLEGTFFLPTLPPGFDTSSLRGAGEYHFRFTFLPKASIASPDGSFCLMRPERQPPATSAEVVVRVEAHDAPAGARP
jgi:hypothetical protein